MTRPAAATQDLTQLLAAIRAQPLVPELHFCMAEALAARRMSKLALVNYSRAIELNPGYVEALLARAAAYQRCRLYAAALQDLQAARALGADQPGLDSHILYLRLLLCDWHGIDATLANFTTACEKTSFLASPFESLALTDSPALRLQLAEHWCLSETTATATRPETTPHDGNGKIRIAYVSAHFHEHPISRQIVELIEAHDRARFTVIALSAGPSADDAFSQRLRRAFDEFIPVLDCSDAEIAALARARNTDIAIDLDGHTESARTGVFFARAAPLQLSYLGFLGTMGSSCYDYLIADPILVRTGEHKYYSEKILRLPSYQVNDSQRSFNAAAFSRAAAGIPPEAFVFCCFNDNYKFNPEVFDSWMRILQQVPHAYLFLYAQNPDVIRNLRSEATRRNINEQRLIFGPELPLDGYLARLAACDLFLDTYPYNAGTTASDALWAGLPVLTRAGATFSSRMAASILHAAGLPELVTDTVQAYETAAIRLATHPSKLQDIRQRWAEQRQTARLSNTRLFAQQLEQAFTLMHERRMAALAPAHLDIQEEHSAERTNASPLVQPT